MNLKAAHIMVLCSFLIFSCKDDVLPKPDAFLALNYKAPEYSLYGSDDCSYEFMKNALAVVRYKSDCSAVLEYPALDAALYLTYRPVTNNIKELLIDAQKLTYEHVIKADNISEEKYFNEEHNVYGMFYDVAGNAASQSQFYVTDSTAHFITGSIYFNVKPNYDSILPAAAYMKNDIRHIMESLRWKK
ncbi:gliding motility lipoprotein GldD [Leeuwenhoekiella sp. MAR_2009_132]|uniref:gliding motility lipoprotein GldD n=1 Tax=Leeuwenhoekiella sp. MAR_2009_132 TaxID=1392489 RepID=UPI0039776ADB